MMEITVLFTLGRNRATLWRIKQVTLRRTQRMKRLVLVCLAAGSLTTQAQLFSPSALGGAFWGSMIGGIAGSDCHHGFSGSGAAIGAGVGLLVGALAGEANRHD